MKFDFESDLALRPRASDWIRLVQHLQQAEASYVPIDTWKRSRCTVLQALHHFLIKRSSRSIAQATTCHEVAQSIAVISIIAAIGQVSTHQSVHAPFPSDWPAPGKRPLAPRLQRTGQEPCPEPSRR